MNKIALRQIYFGGVTIQIPEIWNAETEELIEEDGQKSYSISVSADGNDVRSIDISYGPMPEGSDAYTEACGTFEEVMEEEDMAVNEEPIICFGFQNHKAYGFNVWTDDGLPCFFFCIDIKSGEKTNLLTVLVSAGNNEDLKALMDFTEEYLSVK